MATRNLHDKPFDEGTKTKLTIYRSYVQAWLQVFLNSDVYRGQPLQFFDLFCGPGEDLRHEPGSPMILLNELLSARTQIEQRKHEIRIFFNDLDVAKIESLKRLCAMRGVPWQPRFESLDFQKAFEQCERDLGSVPSLIFVDQNGLKHVTRSVFSAMAAAKKTDFIFFTASSYKRRFGKLLAPEIKLPEKASYLEVHRLLADVYRTWAPADVFIGYFSIRKDSNIYGLIFGSHHWRGMQKFLEIAWKLDSACGEADFELEVDVNQSFMDFDRGTAGFKKRKIEVFQDKLSRAILSRALKTDRDVFLECLTNGFLPRLAREVYTSLRDGGSLKNDRKTFPRYSADVMKEPRLLNL